MQDFLDHTAMSEKFAPPKVAIRRYPASRISDVVVVVRGQEMVVRCPSYSQAVKWARLECKSYKIPEPDTDFADNEEPSDVPRPGRAKREEEWGAEGERGNESGEIARARRNGGAAASARSQASARSAAVRHSAANREISCANSCSERPGIRAIAQRAKGEGEMTMRALVILTAVCFSTSAYAQGVPPRPATSRRGRSGRKNRCGCKLVGRVRGTKLWAGDCVGPELRGAIPSTATQSVPESPTGAILPDQKE